MEAPRVAGSKKNPISNVEDLLGIIKAERNLYTAQQLRILQREQPGSFQDDDVLRVGARVFRDFEIKDLKKIEKAYQGYSIIDASSDLVAEAGLWAFKFLNYLVRRHVITGRYQQSLGMFVRPVGGTDREIRVGTLNADNLPARPVITIIADVAYANKLETLLHHGQIQGFLFHTSKQVKRKFGRDIAVKFDYFSSTRLGRGYKGGSLPRIQISQPGDVRGASRKPGFSRRSRRRR